MPPFRQPFSLSCSTVAGRAMFECSYCRGRGRFSHARSIRKHFWEIQRITLRSLPDSPLSDLRRVQFLTARDLAEQETRAGPPQRPRVSTFVRPLMALGVAPVGPIDAGRTLPLGMEKRKDEDVGSR